MHLSPISSWLGSQRKALDRKLNAARAARAQVPRDGHILSVLDEEGLRALHQFMKIQGQKGVDVEVFVREVSKLICHSLCRSLDFEEEEYVTHALSTLFVSIDSASDGMVDWEEFHSYLLTAYTNYDRVNSSILPYKLQQTNPPMAKCALPTSELMYIEDADQYLAMQVFHNSPSTLSVIPANSPNLSPFAMAEYHGQYLAADLLPSRRLVMASVQENKLLQYRINKAPTKEDEELGLLTGGYSCLQLKKTIAVSSPILRILWDDISGLLFTCTRSGHFQLRGIDAPEGEQVKHTLQVHDGLINYLIDFPGQNPRRVGTAGMDGFVKIIDINSVQTVYEFQPDVEANAINKGGVRSLSFSQDYMFVVTTGYSYIPTVWMPVYTRHRLIAKLEDADSPHRHPLLGAKVLPGTPQIITGDVSGMFKVWDIRMTSVVQTFNIEPDMPPECLRYVKAVNFAVDVKRHWITATVNHTNNNTTRLVTHEPIRPVLPDPTICHNASVMFVCYDTVNSTFLTASQCDVKIWDAFKGSLLLHFPDCTKSEITQVQLNLNNRQFIVGTHAGAVDAHSVGTGMVHHQLHQHTREVTFLHYDSRSMETISASLDGTIVFNKEGHNLRTVRAGHPITTGHVNPTVALALFADARGCVLIYDRLPSFLYCCHPSTPLGSASLLPQTEVVQQPVLPPKTSKRATEDKQPAQAGARPANSSCSSVRSSGSPSNAMLKSLQRGSMLSSDGARPPGSKGKSQAPPSGEPKPTHGTVPRQVTGTDSDMEDISIKAATIASSQSDPTLPHQDLSTISDAEANFATDGQLHYYTHDFEARAAVLTYLTPHSAFLAADTQSSFTIWTVRPSPYAPVYRWKNFKPSEGAHESVVVDMVWYIPTQCLIVGDDEGYIAIWNLAPTLNHLFSGPSANKADRPPDPSIQLCWKAHRSSITSINLLPKMRVLATASTDRSALLWTFEGTLVGGLQQGRGRPDATELLKYSFKPSEPSRAQVLLSKLRPQSWNAQETATLGAVLEVVTSTHMDDDDIKGQLTASFKRCPPPPPGTPRQQSTFRAGLVTGYRADDAPMVEHWDASAVSKPLVGLRVSAISPMKRREAKLGLDQGSCPSLSKWPHLVDFAAIIDDAAAVLKAKITGAEPFLFERLDATPYNAANPIRMLASVPSTMINGNPNHPDYQPSDNLLVDAQVRNFTPWTFTHDAQWGSNVPSGSLPTITHPNSRLLPMSNPNIILGQSLKQADHAETASQETSLCSPSQAAKLTPRNGQASSEGTLRLPPVLSARTSQETEIGTAGEPREMDHQYEEEEDDQGSYDGEPEDVYHDNSEASGDEDDGIIEEEEHLWKSEKEDTLADLQHRQPTAEHAHNPQSRGEHPTKSSPSPTLSGGTTPVSRQSKMLFLAPRPYSKLPKIPRKPMYLEVEPDNGFELAFAHYKPLQPKGNSGAATPEHPHDDAAHAPAETFAATLSGAMEGNAKAMSPFLSASYPPPMLTNDQFADPSVSPSSKTVPWDGSSVTTCEFNPMQGHLYKGLPSNLRERTPSGPATFPSYPRSPSQKQAPVWIRFAPNIRNTEQIQKSATPSYSRRSEIRRSRTSMTPKEYSSAHVTDANSSMVPHGALATYTEEPPCFSIFSSPNAKTAAVKALRKRMLKYEKVKCDLHFPPKPSTPLEAV